jgi:flagellar hook protein FlgE
LLGYPADGQGVIQPGVAGPLQLPTAGIDPSATTEIEIEMTLDSRVAATLPATAPQVNFSDATTYNNATSLTVFDAKGQDVALTYYFQKTATDTWNVYVTANGSSVAVDGAGDPAPVTTINFPSNGGTPTSPVGPVTLDIPASTNSAGAETLAIPGIQLDLSGAKQNGATFGVTNLKQDGYAPGQLSGLTIEDSGIVMATYSNGQSKPAGQIELSTFRNVQGLKPLGGNLWARTFESGDPIVGTPSQGNLGVLQSGALEESNVDLTAELVNMITAQRIYQANAQTIKTQDQVLQTLVNLR